MLNIYLGLLTLIPSTRDRPFLSVEREKRESQQEFFTFCGK